MQPIGSGTPSSTLIARAVNPGCAATIASHDLAQGHTIVALRTSFEPLHLKAPPHEGTMGTSVWVQTRAEDYSIARQPIDGISIQNQVRATVARLTEYRGRWIVEARPRPDVALLIEISEESRMRLGIERGSEIYCLVKSNAIEVTSPRDEGR